MDSEAVKNHYGRQIDQNKKQIALLKARSNVVSNVRLLTVVISIVAAVFSYRADSVVYFAVSIITGIIAFLFLIIFHEKLHTRRVMFERLLAINTRCFDRIEGNWQKYSDSGAEFVDKNHSCSADLDLFGQQSLFQWLAAAHTFYGRKKLASDLTHIPSSCKDVESRQIAIKECAQLLEFRQQFEAIALESGMERDPKKLLEWAETPASRLFASLYSLIIVFPIVSLLVSVISIALLQLPLIAYILGSINIFFYGIFFISNKKFMDGFEKNGKSIYAYSDLMKLIMGTTFVSSFLNECKSKIGEYSKNDNAAHLRTLSSIISSMEIRYNPLGHFVANALFLWDLRMRASAEKWRSLYGKSVRAWLEQIGIIESISSFSAITFENETWVFPSVSDGALHIKAEHAGHPLIPANIRVYNDFKFENNRIAIVTGSNMSGKSTFLRTVGINAMLAYAGAPVCAQSMSCSIVNIYTSMRIEDNLANNISTFYAELIRIKKIIQANNEGNSFLFLLDELFRGTNSEDRHEGAVAVLKRLKNENTIGIISTHDLQLCALGEDRSAGYSNFHFREYYDGKEIRFDYKLNPGPSTTKNALYLLKMLGIT